MTSQSLVSVGGKPSSTTFGPPVGLGPDRRSKLALDLLEAAKVQQAVFVVQDIPDRPSAGTRRLGCIRERPPSSPCLLHSASNVTTAVLRPRLHQARIAAGGEGSSGSRPAVQARACCRASSASPVGAWGSFDDLVGAGEQGRWHCEAQSLCRLEVDSPPRLTSAAITCFCRVETRSKRDRPAVVRCEHAIHQQTFELLCGIGQNQSFLSRGMFSGRIGNLGEVKSEDSCRAIITHDGLRSGAD